MKLNFKYDLYCWACDFSSSRGEGILARHYIKNLSKIQKKKIFIKTPNKNYSVINGIIKNLSIKDKKDTKLNLNFFENYFLPLVGILYLWSNYLKGRGICYLNFLPLWNLFLFIFLPPKTHLGPITGFIFKKKITNFNFFLRKYLNNFLFKFNLKILFNRQNKIYFSTDLLKNLIPNKHMNRISFNYLIHLVEIKNKKDKKNIDLLIYNRNYSVKNNYLRNKLLKILITMNLNIYAIGDHLYLRNIKNLGFISREKTNFLLRKTKFIINSGENPYNIFTIDAFNNHVDIIYEKNFFNKINFFNKQKLFFLNFNNKNQIKTILNKNKIKKSKLTVDYKTLKKKSLIYFAKVKIYYST
jgi:hypothetical protein|tara:strand:- start:16 stop:1083 length:1068 start_codon:yes stop_codon:yes gene_type:complete